MKFSGQTKQIQQWSGGGEDGKSLKPCEAFWKTGAIRSHAFADNRPEWSHNEFRPGMQSFSHSRPDTTIYCVLFKHNPPSIPLLQVRPICTVDLDIPNFWAVARTVARFSIMYTASAQARCSMLPCKKAPPKCCLLEDMRGSRRICCPYRSVDKRACLYYNPYITYIEYIFI